MKLKVKVSGRLEYIDIEVPGFKSDGKVIWMAMDMEGVTVAPCHLFAAVVDKLGVDVGSIVGVYAVSDDEFGKEVCHV